MPYALILVENNSVPTDVRVWAQCNSLREAGWEVAVICPREAGHDDADAEIVNGISIHRFELRPSGGGIVGYAREYLTALIRMRRLARRLCRETTFDVVQLCNPPDFLCLAVLGARRRGAALVFDHHDLSPELFEAKYGQHRLMNRLLLSAERIGFARADVVIATNDSFKRVAMTRGRKDGRDVFVVRNGPDTGTFRPMDADPDLRSGAPMLIGYVGLIGSQDGVDVALDALAILRRRRTDWRAVFVGDGDGLADAEARKRELALGDVVTFTGFVRDRATLVRTIASCDVCISPEPRNSLNERSTLIKVAEYMAVGKPVVAFDLAETRATAGDAAAYASGDDPAAFAEAIESLLDDPERRCRLGIEARRRVEAVLSWERSEQALLAAYERAYELARARRYAS